MEEKPNYEPNNYNGLVDFDRILPYMGLVPPKQEEPCAETSLLYKSSQYQQEQDELASNYQLSNPDVDMGFSYSPPTSSSVATRIPFLNDNMDVFGTVYTPMKELTQEVVPVMKIKAVAEEVKESGELMQDLYNKELTVKEMETLRLEALKNPPHKTLAPLYQKLRGQMDRVARALPIKSSDFIYPKRGNYDDDDNDDNDDDYKKMTSISMPTVTKLEIKNEINDKIKEEANNELPSFGDDS
eukprot:g512.t1